MGKGIWITDNSKYKSDNEPYDAYRLECKCGLGKKSIIGSLYGIKDGKNIGVFWNLKLFLHPGEGKALTEQFGGDGTYGIGEITLQNEQTTRMLQTFYSPNHSSCQVGHESMTNAKVHKTNSYKIKADGTWVLNRTYLCISPLIHWTVF